MLNWPFNNHSLRSLWVPGSRQMWVQYLGRHERKITPSAREPPGPYALPILRHFYPTILSNNHFYLKVPGYQDSRFIACSDLGQPRVPQFPHQTEIALPSSWIPLRHAVEKHCLSALMTTMDYLLFPRKLFLSLIHLLVKKLLWIFSLISVLPQVHPITHSNIPPLVSFPKGEAEGCIFKKWHFVAFFYTQ